MSLKHRIKREAIPQRALYPLPEAFTLLGISADKAYRLMKAGALRYVTIGATRHIPHAEIERVTTEGAPLTSAAA